MAETQKFENFTHVSVTTADIKYPSQFKIIELKKYDMIWYDMICGKSYLVKYKITLDFSTRKIIVKGKSISFENRKLNCNSIVYTVEKDGAFCLADHAIEEQANAKEIMRNLHWIGSWTQ